jgi:acetyl esterase
MEYKIAVYCLMTVAVPLFVISLGVLFPRIPLMGELGTICESFFSIHLVILSLAALFAFAFIFRMDMNRVTSIGLALSVFSSVALLIPFVTLLSEAGNRKVDISWADMLRVKLGAGRPDPASSVKYATVDGQDLYVQISLPPNNGSAGSRIPVVLIHGGGYVRGTRNLEPAWTRFFNQRGYVVFDVDYRLAKESYFTWDKAAPDIATAILWVGNHAAEYKIDMGKLILAGSSAGGGLALQTAYGINDGTVKSYEVGSVYPAKAVIALYPCQDLSGLWKKNPRLFGIGLRALSEAFIGGTPAQYPDRYALVDAGAHISSTSPPTLMVVGKNDHLLPFADQKALAEKLSAAGVTNEFVVLPFNDHFFTIAVGSLGSQISFKVAGDFLAKLEAEGQPLGH